MGGFFGRRRVPVKRALGQELGDSEVEEERSERLQRVHGFELVRSATHRASRVLGTIYHAVQIGEHRRLVARALQDLPREDAWNFNVKLRRRPDARGPTQKADALLLAARSHDDLVVATGCDPRIGKQAIELGVARSKSTSELQSPLNL